MVDSIALQQSLRDLDRGFVNSKDNKKAIQTGSLFIYYSSIGSSKLVNNVESESVNSSTLRKVRLMALVRLPTISVRVLSAVWSLSLIHI